MAATEASRRLGADSPMRHLVTAFLATVAAIAAHHHHPKPHPQRHHHPRPLKLPADYAAWTRVADCESGGWVVLGGAYPDSLGISRANYERFGGVPQPPGPVTVANRVVQIRIADRLIAAYGAAIPDQYGCHAW